ncbi:recombinase RecT [Oscillospiraceae bacterium LCP25S3_E4]
MAVTTNTAGAIAKASSTQIKSKKAPSTIKDYINLYSKEIAKALPSVLTPERFSRMAMTAITKTPKLAECSPQSFIGSLLTAAQLGLEPNTPLGQAYLIPFYNGKKRTYECQFQVGYKGMIDLCNRSGEIKNIEAHIVYENDEFEFEYGLDSKLKHKPCMSDKGAPVWVYALYRLNNGGYGFEVMSVDDCMAHGEKYSKTFNNSPWQTNPEEMMKKTVLKKVLKYAPVRSDFVKGAVADETIQVADFGDADDGEINVIPVEVENSNEVEVDTETGEVKED